MEHNYLGSHAKYKESTWEDSGFCLGESAMAQLTGEVNKFKSEYEEGVHLRGVHPPP